MAAAQFVELEADGLSVRGWVGGPDEAHNLSDGQFLSLNGRYVRDRQLAHAVRMAFGEAIPTGRFPVYALAIALTPSDVDVNVHPGKLEVRFADVRAVHDLLYVAVRRALEHTPELESSAASRITVAETAGDYSARAAVHRAPSHGVPVQAASQLGPPLALVDERYLLYRDGALVRSLDLRAAWTEVLSRRLLTANVARRPLLIPERIAANSQLWKHFNLERLSAYGFEFDDLGPAGHLLRAVPVVLPELSWAIFFEQLAAPSAGTDGERCVRAACVAIVLGNHGQASRRVLDALEQGAAACGLALAFLSQVIDGQLLAGRGLERG